MIRQITILLSSLILSTGAIAQDFTQTIRGYVYDKQSGISLPGANIILLNTEKPSGTISDQDGNFILDDIPVGRVSLRISYMGYDPVELSNISITSGKELKLEVGLEENILSGDEVTIFGNPDKTRAINSMSLASARTFSVEETDRYAGARGDVARMAANYAGVGTANDGVNELVIRGNSPWGLLWKLEGVDIPNPNHFGNMGMTGGPVSMLNNNLLSNSDFLTGAFAAEYGNALSGVFDLNLRKGNADKYEFMGMVGFNGFEGLVEGPLVPGKKASFMVDYRYSTLGLVSDLGVEFGTGTAVPEYQDLTFRIDVPANKAGHFSLFGLGGKSYIEFIRSSRDTTASESEGFYNDEHLDIYSGNRLGVLGFGHKITLDQHSFLRTTLSYSGIRNYSRLDSVSTKNQEPHPYGGTDQWNQQLSFSSFYNRKINAKNTLRSGIGIKKNIFSLKDSVYWATYDDFFELRNDNGSIMIYDAYVEWKYRPVEQLSINSGIFGQYLALNDTWSVEPRMAFKYDFSQDKSLSFAYGLHSKMQPLEVYYLKTRTGMDSYEETNRDLDFTKAHHFVIGFDWNLNTSLRIKAEGYCQKLFNAPIQKESSYYSMLNYSSLAWAVEDSLINKGTGRNIGLDLTVERFLDKGLYFLLTASVFDSKYRGSDQVLRSTSFDSDYVLNFLIGKEFEITRNRDGRTRKWLSVDGKLSTAGGLRYLPVDVEMSREKLITVYDYDNAFESKLNNYFKADLQISLRIDAKKHSQEWSVYVENFTNHKNPYYLLYNPEMENGIETIYQLGLFPMMQYKIHF